MSIDKMSMPKNASISFTIAKVESNKIRPINALVILDLALSIWALSPPEIIQETAPQSSMKKKATAPKTKIKPMIFGSNSLNKIATSGASNKFCNVPLMRGFLIRLCS